MLQVRLDSFDKVKTTLQNMVDKLVEEKEEELAKKEACVDGFNKNSGYTAAGNRKKEQLIAEIDDLQMTQDQLATEKILTASLNILKGFYETLSLAQAGHGT